MSTCIKMIHRPVLLAVLVLYAIAYASPPPPWPQHRAARTIAYRTRNACIKLIDEKRRMREKKDGARIGCESGQCMAIRSALPR